MKKIIFLLIVMWLQVSMRVSTAQTVNFYLTTDSVVYCGTEYFTFWASAIIENNGLNPVVIKANRLINQVPNYPYWLSAMCADICYPTAVDSIQFTILPDTSQLFKMMFQYWVHNTDTAHTLIHYTSLTPGIIFEYYQNFYAMDSLVLTTDVNEALQNQNNTVDIYPNPFRNEIFLRTSGKNPITLAIKNILVQTVFQKDISSAGKSLRQLTEDLEGPINLEFLPQGIYLLEINFGEERVVKKIVKQ